MQKNTRKVKFSGAAHEKRTAAQFSVQQSFCVSGKTGAQPSEAKNSLVSLTTVPESSSNAMRLGMLIRPLKVSAMLHSRPRSTVAPRMDTKEYTTKKGFATLSLWQRNTRKREPYRWTTSRRRWP